MHPISVLELTKNEVDESSMLTDALQQEEQYDRGNKEPNGNLPVVLDPPCHCLRVNRNRHARASRTAHRLYGAAGTFETVIKTINIERTSV